MRPDPLNVRLCEELQTEFAKARLSGSAMSCALVSLLTEIEHATPAEITQVLTKSIEHWRERNRTRPSNLSPRNHSHPVGASPSSATDGQPPTLLPPASAAPLRLVAKRDDIKSV